MTSGERNKTENSSNSLKPRSYLVGYRQAITPHVFFHVNPPLSVSDVFQDLPRIVPNPTYTVFSYIYLPMIELNL